VVVRKGALVIVRLLLIVAWITPALFGCGPGQMVFPGAAAPCGDDDDSTNQPPDAPTVTIEPAEPTGADDLVCVITAPSTDPDGDEVTYAYSWAVGDSPTNLSSDTVVGEYTGDGQEWTCTVVPTDGTAEGPPGEATIAISGNEFRQIQSLSGGPSSVDCPDCDYAFDVTYTTVSVTGSCSTSCSVLFPDGAYSMGYSSAYSMIVRYFSYHGEAVWYPWYYADVDDTHIDFWWDGYGYSSYGYWDMDGDTLTGQAVNEEP
jgi:hypothetical protein